MHGCLRPQFNRTTFNSRNYLIKIQFCSCMRGAAVVWEARYGIEETRLIWSKQSASNLWRPYANLYTLCVLWWSPIDGKLYHFYFLFSSSSYRYCAVFIAIPFCPSFPSCTIVENWIIKFGIWIRGRKHSIWDMRVW